MRSPRPAALLTLGLLAACHGIQLGGGGGKDKDVDGSPGGGADADGVDAAVTDAAPPDAIAPDAPVPGGPPYQYLSQTGLYTDIATKELAPEVIEFEPAHKLWSDAAVKTRWILLPEGTQIDTSDMDHWRFPVGTKVWKEFRHEDAGVIRLETRLIERVSQDEFWVGAFVWRENESDAEFAEFGATDVRGTAHDVPDIYDCEECHGGEQHRFLGFSAVQLSHGGPGPTLDSLAADGLLTNPPPQGVTYPVPGNAVESAALGYLHANCGHCHQNNPGAPITACYDVTELDLRIRVAQQTVQETSAYLTAVDQQLLHWVTSQEGNHDGFTLRIDPGSPTTSAIWYRMSARHAGASPPYDENQQMPPDFTDMVDADGVAKVEAWINSL